MYKKRAGEQDLFKGHQRYTFDVTLFTNLLCNYELLKGALNISECKGTGSTSGHLENESSHNIIATGY